MRAAIVAALAEGLPAADVTVVDCADAAAALLRETQFDLILTDDVGARAGGWDGPAEGRAEPLGESRHLIVMTADAAAGARAALAAGAGDFVVKPLRPDELVSRVRAALARAGEARELSTRAVELERLRDRQSEFLSWVSHEIRTPLSAIISSANILLRYGQKRPESIERFARVIHQEGQRLTRLINNLLDLTKIEAGQVEWRFLPIPLAGLVEQVRESFAALAGERKLGLEVTCSDHPESIVADRDKLTQVLVNLVSNAIKHSPEGGVVTLRCATATPGGVRIEVEDQGAGIPAGQEERVFERFQQLDASDERTGTGLGLTISREIVEHHGGRIWAEVGRSRGALFVVELPQEPSRGVGDGPVR